MTCYIRDSHKRKVLKKNQALNGTQVTREIYTVTYFLVYADECVAEELQPPRISARRLNIGMVDVLYETSEKSANAEGIGEHKK